MISIDQLSEYAKSDSLTAIKEISYLMIASY